MRYILLFHGGALKPVSHFPVCSAITFLSTLFSAVNPVLLPAPLPPTGPHEVTPLACTQGAVVHSLEHLHTPFCLLLWSYGGPDRPVLHLGELA